MGKKNNNYELGSGNVFADLDLDQSDELLTRAQLLHEVSSLIKASKLSQKEIAAQLEISQPKVSLLINGHLSAFSTDTLIHYLSLLGCHVEIRVKKPRSNRGIKRKKGRISLL